MVSSGGGALFVPFRLLQDFPFAGSTLLGPVDLYSEIVSISERICADGSLV